MKFLKSAVMAAALCSAALLSGCEGAMNLSSPKLPDLSGGYSASAEITYGSNTAQAAVTRSEPGCWEFSFSKPAELSGVIMRVADGKLTASLGDMSVTAGGGDYTVMPKVIAEGIDSLSSAKPSDITEENGILTIKLRSAGKSCTVTADKATGDILSFKSPGNKLAVYFSDVSPYTEEVGLIEE